MTYPDFVRAQPEHEMGLRSPLRHMSPEARERLAFHEAGHAVAVRLFLPQHRISRITIVRQGAAFGHVWHYSARESFDGLDTKEEYLNRLRVSAAGKAAEIEFCGVENQTLGVAGDLARIQGVLNMMSWSGMFGPLGANVALGFDPVTMTFHERLTPPQLEAIDEAYRKIMDETRAAMREHRHIVEALVAELLDKDELLADDVRAFFEEYGLHTPEPTTVRDGEEIRLVADNRDRIAAAGTPDAADKA